MKDIVPDHPNSEFPESAETALRRDLNDRSNVVMRLGKMLLSSGAGAYRVKFSMARCAKAVGLDKLESHVALMDLSTTAWKGKEFRTQISETRTVGVNAAKLDRLMVLSAHLTQNMSVETLNSALDRIEEQDRHYSIFASVLAAAFACAGFTFLNNGRTAECALVFFAAGVGQLARRLMLAKSYAHFVIWTVCAAISTLIYMGLAEVLFQTGIINGLHQAGVMSSFLYLIPGFPMVTAILDFVRMDFRSAITRINYCLMVIGSAGCSVWVISRLLDWQVQAVMPAPMAYPLLITLQAISSLVAAYGFAVLFNAPWKVAAVSGMIGALVNTSRLFLQHHTIPWQLAVGLAACAAGILATMVAKKTAHSRVSLSVPAVVIMIPGVPFYRALVALNDGNILRALGPTFEVFFVVMSIGFGLALSRVLSDPGWLVNAQTAQINDDLEATSKSANI